MKTLSMHAAMPAAPQGRARTTVTGASLWTAFWQEFCLENEPQERCHIPGDGQQVVDRHWAEFAHALPRNAQVLDLGCGAGILGRLLLRHRSDLGVIGIDFADVPAISAANLTIHRWVSMEELPFGEDSFDAAISLFGIEYGNIDRTARELARVLRPGARFSFIVHHRESEIASEGRTRRAALRELLSGKTRAAFLAGGLGSLDRQLERLRTLFPGEPSIRLFSNYLRHHAVRTRAERHTTWQTLLDGLDPELALLVQLEKSAKAAAEMGAWLVPLLSAMGDVSVSVLRRRSGEPIAWQVSGSR